MPPLLFFHRNGLRLFLCVLFLLGNGNMQLVQLLLHSPRDVPSRGGPADLTCSAEMDSACAKALLAQGAYTALRAGVEQKQEQPVIIPRYPLPSP